MESTNQMPEAMKAQHAQMVAMMGQMGIEGAELEKLIADLQSGKLDQNGLIRIIMQNQGATQDLVEEEEKGPSQTMNSGGQENGLNGSYADPLWAQPKVSVKSELQARKGFEHNNITKTEYADSDAVLSNKVTLMAKMIKQSKNCVFYVGAGMSTSAGCNDYASKKKITETGNRLQLQPTLQYHVSNSMYEKGYIKQFISQNHDGLAQKAGLPWSIVNEIHGGWFDKKNGVKMMDDRLDPKNLARFNEWIPKADVVVVIGTSLAGMNADRIAQAGAFQPGKNLIILNNQENTMSKHAHLNLFGDITKTFTLLAKALNIQVKKNPKVYDQTEFRK